MSGTFTICIYRFKSYKYFLKASQWYISHITVNVAVILSNYENRSGGRVRNFFLRTSGGWELEASGQGALQIVGHRGGLLGLGRLKERESRAPWLVFLVSNFPFSYGTQAEQSPPQAQYLQYIRGYLIYIFEMSGWRG